MPVKIKPTSSIKARLGLEPNGKVQLMFANTCKSHMDKYVPMDQGDLRTIVDVQPKWITYEMPYASYQYYGMRKDGTHIVRNYTTTEPVMTGPYWDRRMVSAEIDIVIEEVQEYIGGKR